MPEPVVTIIGEGLAGCEAAWQAARRERNRLLVEHTLSAFRIWQQALPWEIGSTHDSA